MHEPENRTDSVAVGDAPYLAESVLAAGHVVAGRYRIEQVLGKGGYAIVYRAFDERLGIPIALKILRPERASAAALNRFRREVHLPRGVSSENIVRVFDIGNDGPLCYLTMELVEGQSLRERIAGGPLAIDEALRISRGVLEGIASLHSLNIIHRDIKPENILLAGEHVKVADFGLSRYVDDEERSSSTGALVGTLRYLPPEQLKGHRPGAPGDLYTFGLVLFEMLAGQTPFTAESSVGVMLNRLQAPAPDIRRFRPDVPAWLANVIARVLEREPDARYGTAREVIAALDAKNAPPSRSKRRRIAVVAFAAVAIVLIATVVAMQMRAAALRRFSHLVARPDGGIAAVSAGGQTLWERREVDVSAASRWALARRAPGAEPELAVVLNAQDDFALARVLQLSFLEPGTGRVVDIVTLPGEDAQFPRSPARFYPGKLLAADLNGDGADEIITWFGHVPEWASFVVLHEPLKDRSRVLFIGYGQHGIGGLFDVTGDGRKELILFGHNNGLGWYNAMAALRMDLPWTVNPDRSPDFGGPVYLRNSLLWYALLPRGYSSNEDDSLTFDPSTRLFTVRYLNQSTFRVTADGFLPESKSPLPLPRRQEARFGAYAHLREARRLSHARAHDLAVRRMDAAVAEAARSGESILLEAMHTERLQILIAAGRAADAERALERIIPGAEYAAEAAFDGARAFHLHGDLDLALKWYRTGFALRARVESGKSIHEFLQGMTFVHAERRDWAAAEEDLERFNRTFVDSASDSIGMYREFLRWRAGRIPSTHYKIRANATDVLRYWSLEFRHARGEDPRTVLRDLDVELAAGSSETQSAMFALRAELLAALDRKSDARDAIARATALLSDDIGVSVIARVHAGLVGERASKIGGSR